MVSDPASAGPQAVIERLNASINDHDIPASRSCYAPGARFVTAAGKRLDVDGQGALLAHTLAAFPDLKMTVLRWIVDGETVVTEEVMEATHRGDWGGIGATGVAVRVPMVHLTRVRDGRIIERVAYHDTAAILRQLQAAAG